MNTKRAMGMAVIFVTVLACQSAQAFYNPHTGRWLSRDPIGERGGANLNACVYNQPINYCDRYGLEVLHYPVVNGEPTVETPNVSVAGATGAGAVAATGLVLIPVGAAAEFWGPGLLAWLGFGGAAASSPQAQKVIQPMLAAINQAGKVILNPNLMLSHKVFAQQALGAQGTCLPQGTWVGTVVSANGQIVGLNSMTFFGNQLPANPQVQQALQQALK